MTTCQEPSGRLEAPFSESRQCNICRFEASPVYCALYFSSCSFLTQHSIPHILEICRTWFWGMKSSAETDISSSSSQCIKKIIYNTTGGQRVIRREAGGSSGRDGEGGEGRASEMAQQAKAVHSQNWQPEFDPQDPHGDWFLQSCKLFPDLHTCVHMCVIAHIHIQINIILKRCSGRGQMPGMLWCRVAGWSHRDSAHQSGGNEALGGREQKEGKRKTG